MTDKTYRECMAEIMGVLKKYDMAGAITLVDKERSMFKYYFPTWSCVTLTETQIRLKAKREDFPTVEAQRKALELSAHCIMQMRDCAMNTYGLTENIGQMLTEKFGMEHKANVDFDPELSN